MAATNGSETRRRQLPFRVCSGIAYGFPVVELEYDAYTVLDSNRTIKQPMRLRQGDLANAILELIRLYNDALEENAVHQKNYEIDRRTIAQLDAEVAKLKNQLRGHETRPKK